MITTRAFFAEVGGAGEPQHAAPSSGASAGRCRATLEHLLPENRFDVARFLAGSEARSQ